MKRILKMPNDDTTFQLFEVRDDEHLRELVDFAMSSDGGTDERELNSAVQSLLEEGATQWCEGPEAELLEVTDGVGIFAARE